MPLKPLPGFRSLATHHCVTGSMRHVYEFHDHPPSEDLLLGLGAGVGFIYWHMKGMPPMLGGRANFERPGEEGLEKTAGKRTGVRVESFQTTSARKAEASLLEMLDAGEPVMV
ncbi:MAG: BtrH N-terminal domain-containing protein, partial [Armatimonadota bacterium]